MCNAERKLKSCSLDRDEARLHFEFQEVPVVKGRLLAQIPDVLLKSLMVSTGAAIASSRPQLRQIQAVEP
jgi:hypothetical protein